MLNVSAKEQCSGKFFKAGFPAQDLTLTIRDLTVEDMGNGKQEKVLWFYEHQAGLVMKPTKWEAVGALLGDQTSTWKDKQIVIGPGKTRYQGKMVDCVEVKMVAPPPPAPGQGQVVTQPLQPQSMPAQTQVADDDDPFGP